VFLLIISQFDVIDTYERKAGAQQPKKYLSFEAPRSWCSSNDEQSNPEATLMTKTVSHQLESEQTQKDGDGTYCPECGARLIFQEGCMYCPCGYAVCNGGGH